MSGFSDLTGSIFSALTGTTPDQLQAQATLAEQQITTAVQTIIVLEAVVAVELGIILVILWTRK